MIQAGGRAWVGHAVVFACAPFTLLMMAARVWLHRLADRHLAQRLGTKTLFRVSYAALAASRLPDLLAHFDVDAAALLLPPAAATAPPPPRPFGWVPFLGGGGGGGAAAEASPLPTSPQDVLLVNFVIALMLGAYMVLLATFSPGWSLGRVGIIAANIGSILLGSSSSAADADGPLTAVEDRLLLITALALGVCVAHVLEREKRGHMLELMRLTRQLRASSDFGSFAANASEKAALETALGSPLLSDKILKARVDLADLRARDKALGHGAFGTVRAAEWRGARVAVKQLHRNRINERDLHAFTRSAELELSIGAHENVVRLLGLAWSIDSALVISVMELCGGGTLAEALDTKQLGGTGRRRAARRRRPRARPRLPPRAVAADHPPRPQAVERAPRRRPAAPGAADGEDCRLWDVALPRARVDDERRDGHAALLGARAAARRLALRPVGRRVVARLRPRLPAVRVLAAVPARALLRPGLPRARRRRRRPPRPARRLVAAAPRARVLPERRRRAPVRRRDRPRPRAPRAAVTARRARHAQDAHLKHYNQEVWFYAFIYQSLFVKSRSLGPSTILIAIIDRPAPPPFLVKSDASDHAASPTLAFAHESFSISP